MERLLSQMPFIVISRENLLAANDMLDREQKGELLEMIIDTVLNDGNPKGESKCVNGVYNQFMSVSERKAASYFGRKEHMDEVNEQKKKGKKTEEPQVSTYSDTPPSQEAATYYPPVPDDEARDFPTQEDKEEWYATLIPDGHPNRKDKFNKEWSYYFTSRTEAAKKAEAYLAKNKIHVSLM
jgi:hypothetical protein